MAGVTAVHDRSRDSSPETTGQARTAARHPAGSGLHALGNQEVQLLLVQRAIQAKLAISQPSDPDEGEADRVAEQVMRMEEPGPISSASGLIQRKCAACEAGGATCPKCEEEGKVKRKETPRHAASGPTMRSQIATAAPRGLGLTSAPPSVHEVLSSPGQPLPSSARTFFEPRFGADFSQVRVHTDAAAHQSTRTLNAAAYTVGRHIVFGADQYAPETDAGQRVLAHELTHTVQQSAASIPAMLGVEPGDSAFEHEAERNADWVMSAPVPVAQIPGAGNDRPSISTARIASLQRQRRGAAAGCGICMNDFGGRLAGRIAHCEVQEAFTAANPDIVAERPVPIPGTPSMPPIPVPCLQRPVPPVPTVDLSYVTSEHGQTVIYLGEIKPLDDAGVQGPVGRAQLQGYAREFVLSGQYDDRVYRMQDSPPPGPLFFENPMNPPGCRPQMIIVQLTEPGLYQYYCEPPFSELVRDPDCCPEEEEPKDKEPKDKEPGPSTLPEQLLQLGEQLAPLLAAAVLLDIGLAIAGALGSLVTSPLLALAAVILGIAFFWDKLKWLAGRIAAMAQWVWDEIARLAEFVWDKFTWILGKLYELGIKLGELGIWLAGKIVWLADKLAEGLSWIGHKIAAGGRWLGRKIASAAEAIWDWLWGSDVEPMVPIIEMPVIEEPTQHCATVAHEDTIVKLDADLLFPFNKWELKLPEADDLLTKAAAQIVPLLQKDDDRIIIGGYTDVIGSDEYNQWLSEQRAGAVATWFVENGGVPMSRIRTRGYGKTEAKARANDEKGREKDRRVEIWVPKHGAVEKVCW